MRVKPEGKLALRSCRLALSSGVLVLVLILLAGTAACTKTDPTVAPAPLATPAINIERTAIPLSEGDIPLPPAKLTAVPDPEAAHVIRLAWLDSNNETSYVVERSIFDESGPWEELGAVPANSAHDYDKVAQGVTYFYRVKARNSAGDSPYSNTASASTKCERSAPLIPGSITGRVVLWGGNQHRNGVSIHAGTYGYTCVTESRPDGSFALGEILPGYYLITFSKAGFAQVEREAVVAEAESISLPDVWMFKNVSIKGRVVFEDDRPAVGVAVILLAVDKEGGVKAYTDERGYYQFPDVAPGWYWLESVIEDNVSLNNWVGPCVQALVSPGTDTLAGDIILSPGQRPPLGCP